MAETASRRAPLIAVIIPAYRVRSHILSVLARIGPEISRVFVVDDDCPMQSGDFVEQTCTDPRVVVLRNKENQGVGGAVVAGYQAAIAEGMDILVKVDGDGQMDPALISQLAAPILNGASDYTKGNRFFSPEAIEGMPLARLIGNMGLSFLTKLSSGYWDILDPTNGFTAIHARVANALPFEKLAKRYFFESDLLFRLSTLRAVVTDVPMASVYSHGASSLNAAKMVLPFLYRNLLNWWKRIAYSYFVRGFSFASLCLVVGAPLFGFGAVFGLARWVESSHLERDTPAGIIMLAVVPLLVGFQLLLAFVAADIASVPTKPLHSVLSIRPLKALQHFDTQTACDGR